MPADPSFLREGLSVRDQGGSHIGNIKRIWPDVASSGEVMAPGNSLPGDEPVAPGNDPNEHQMTGRGSFEVDHGGILGIGQRALYVPFAAIYDIVPGDRVILNCFTDECVRLYAARPADIPDN